MIPMTRKRRAGHIGPARFFEPVREVLPGNCAGKASSRTIGPASSCRFYGGVMPSGPTVLYEKGTEIRLPKGRRESGSRVSVGILSAGGFRQPYLRNSR